MCECNRELSIQVLITIHLLKHDVSKGRVGGICLSGNRWYIFGPSMNLNGNQTNRREKIWQEMRSNPTLILQTLPPLTSHPPPPIPACKYSAGTFGSFCIHETISQLCEHTNTIDLDNTIAWECLGRTPNSKSNGTGRIETHRLFFFFFDNWISFILSHLKTSKNRNVSNCNFRKWWATTNQKYTFTIYIQNHPCYQFYAYDLKALYLQKKKSLPI